MTTLLQPPAAPVLEQDTARPARRLPKLWRILGYLTLGVAAVAVLLPFYWMVMSSLKTNNEVFAIPVRWITTDPVWSNYADIWRKSEMTTWLGNTVFLSAVVTLLQVFTGSFAAYGFSKVRFPGRDVLFLAYIGTLAVPWQSYMVPQFVMMTKLQLTDTLWSIVALQAFGALGVFMMKQFYETIPDELIDAARIDGMSEFGIYRRVMLPLSKPALASLTLITLVTTWNDYMGPLLYLRSPDLWTVQLGLKSFISQYNAEYALIMTGSVLSVLPIVVIFLAGQRYFVEGVATTGLKG
ncbi:carbohydrate ABC transporter permease [Actinoplanes sp. NEAU-A12]|uniref:Carbohydrate ABC transporter permease n=1 Tax=Actinoplanes sandaracinus TaxID=3045177 RepID=A0ABT6WSA0_9ACTN|nr:carbohydrate ABC transporter permease [Actinoplanes sandaracinus]MDI6102627.1 carbohydrate ABC transporter permease [Actinoplanes sandaracinus]